MAWAPLNLTSLLLPFLVFFCSSALNPMAPALLTTLFDSDRRPYPANGSTVLVGPAGPAMILPLFHYNPRSQTASSSSAMLSNAKHRKNLQKSIPNSLPHARMGLYDDLLLDGYYTTHLWIGTPPQKFSLIVDTGSTVTYVPCSTCEQCGSHEDPKFEPGSSSTYEPMKCSMECNCNDENGFCIYERQYAEMSTSSGVLGLDLLSFGNDSGLDPQRAVFGCENVETGDLYSQHADGIMGLGRGDLSIVDQLVDKGVINDSFSLCYGGMDVGGGAMVLGSISPPADMVFTASDPLRSPYYNIDLKEIHVAGKKLQLDAKIFNGKYGTVLDSGTTYAYLPEEAFYAFKDAIMKELHSLKQIHGPDPNYNDICFSGASSNVSELSHTFPKVELMFDKEHKLLLSPENYLFRHSKVPGAYCLGVFQNGKDPTTLLGGIITRNTLVVYDRENTKVGFWKTNCSELWERLQVTTSPAPSPHPSHENNQNEEASPTLAPSPSDLSHYALRDGIYIGRIEFEMLFSINYQDLKKNLHNLTQHIAQELRINISQVHVESLSPEGNDSLLGLSIVPLASTHYISNGTALSIIGRVVKHQMTLPVTFGTYKLVQWKVQPPQQQQAWWETHYLPILIAAISTLVIGLFGVGFWLVLRQRQNALTAYKPVDDDAPEQELQPL